MLLKRRYNNSKSYTQTTKDLPPGEYASQIIEVNAKGGNEYSGQYFMLLKVVDGMYEGQIVMRSYLDKFKHFASKDVELFGVNWDSRDSIGNNLRKLINQYAILQIGETGYVTNIEPADIDEEI